MITVFHRLIPTFRVDRDGILNRADFEQVALVDTGHLDTAFRLTNHIIGAWQENPGVTALTPTARSTSVGDALQDQDGRIWEVAPIGFTESVWSSAPEPETAENTPSFMDSAEGDC